MELSPEPIIYGLVFVAVLILVEGLYLTVFGRSIGVSRPRHDSMRWPIRPARANQMMSSSR